MSTLSYITDKQQSTINVNPLINHQETIVINQCQPSHTSLTNNSQQSMSTHQNQWVKEFLLGLCLDYSDSDRTEVRLLSFYSDSAQTTRTPIGLRLNLIGLRSDF